MPDIAFGFPSDRRFECSQEVDKDMAIDFVLIASQRTGSNMLVSVLDSHPSIRCHGELFRRKNVKGVGALKVLSEIDDVYASEEYREQHYREYLDAVRSTEEDQNVLFGFKLMLNQAENARAEIVNDQAVKKVLLYRENALAVYASNLIARATGQGVAIVGREIKQAKVGFDEERFEKFLRNYVSRYEEVRNQLRKRPRSEWMELSYVNACKPEGIEKVLGFLGGNSKGIALSSKTAKRNSSVIVDRFSNPEIVKDHLKKIGRSEWAEENA